MQFFAILLQLLHWLMLLLLNYYEGSYEGEFD